VADRRGTLDLFVRSAENRRYSAERAALRRGVQGNAGRCLARAHRPTIEDSETVLRSRLPEPHGLSLLRGRRGEQGTHRVWSFLHVRPDLSTSTGALQVEGEFALARPLGCAPAPATWSSRAGRPSSEVRSNLRRHARASHARLPGSPGPLGQRRDYPYARHRVRCDTSSGAIRLDGLLARGDRDDVGYCHSPLRRSWGRATRCGLRRPLQGACDSPSGATPAARSRLHAGRFVSVRRRRSQGRHLRLAGRGPTVVVTTTSGRVELF